MQRSLKRFLEHKNNSIVAMKNLGYYNIVKSKILHVKNYKYGGSAKI
jgi:hypothetical protein